MRKQISAFIGVALAFAFVPGLTAQAIRVETPGAKSVSDFVQDDTAAAALESAAILLKYVGAEESGTVDINTNALELFSGDLAAESNAPTDGSDVNTGDVCGTANNALDVTDAECDTPAELCNVINDSGAPWVCVLGSVLGSETLATAAEYIDPADAQAKQPGGYALQIDNSGVDAIGVLVRPDIGTGRSVKNVGVRNDIEFFLSGPTAGAYTQTLKDNPFSGQTQALTFLLANLDSTAAWSLDVHCVRYKADGRRDERQVFGTTATADVTDEILDWLADAPLVCAEGEAILIRASDDALVTGLIAYTAQVW